MGMDKDSAMVQSRQSDCINIIFDQNGPASSRSHPRSSSSGGSSRSSGSGRCRGRGTHRGRHRSSSSSSRSRSRSHPRCHRRSSRCRCDNHDRNGSGRYSKSPSPDRYSRRRHHRSRPRSSNCQSRHRRDASRYRSPSRTNRSSSRSRLSGRSASLSVDDKRVLIQAAKASAMKILGMEKLEIPESVKPFLAEQSESKWVSPETWVRQDPEKTPSQSDEEEPDMSSPRMSPERKIISFSINNSVAKPTLAAPSCAKVTPRVDIYESRKPYGHWVPVKSGQSSNARKRTLAMSH